MESFSCTLCEDISLSSIPLDPEVALTQNGEMQGIIVGEDGDLLPDWSFLLRTGRTLNSIFGSLLIIAGTIGDNILPGGILEALDANLCRL